MANAYATIQDYEMRYGAVEDPERVEIIETRLADAATMLDSLVRTDDVDDDMAELLRIVSCNMVSRTMAATDGGLAGIGQVSYGMGPFSQSATLANPSGDMYLTAAERRWLDIGGSVIGSMRAKVGR